VERFLEGGEEQRIRRLRMSQRGLHTNPLCFCFNKKMEKKLKIKVSEKNYIYGRLSGTSRQPLFIIVHGFLETMDGDFYLNATRYFAKQGYATFRFNLYGGEKNARQMIDTTLKINASDIDAMVRYFRRNKFQKIFILHKNRTWSSSYKIHQGGKRVSDELGNKSYCWKANS